MLVDQVFINRLGCVRNGYPPIKDSIRAPFFKGLLMALLPTEGHIVAGVKIDRNRFVGKMKAAQLFQVVIDPRRTEDLRELEGNTQMESIRHIRLEVQRLFEGAKARNVESYAQYIVNVFDGQDGMAPPIILFTEKALQTDETEGGHASVQIPWDVQLVAIDGETQLAARFEAANIKEDTKNEFVTVVFCHDRTVQWARQVFHDLNLLAVRPNAALGLSFDERDPLTQVAREVGDTIPFFKGRVNTKRRQLGSRDKDVLTFTALRGACVTLAEGIGGVKYGAKPVTISKERIPAIKSAALEWFEGVAKTIGPAIENRSQTLAGASSVMSAIGAMGHELVDLQEADKRAELCKSALKKLRDVNWEKAKHWEGIAGKFGMKGKFSTSGAKDAAYAIYSALNDETSSGFKVIRNGVATANNGEASDQPVLARAGR
jgi:DGQHR domain-containing protein